MTSDEMFAVWAPERALWSRWVKPVLFAYLDAATPDPPAVQAAWDLSWAPGVEARAALVLDLPGAESVFVGLALAARGYQPVPLFNAVPLPAEEPLLDPDSGRPVAAVNVLPILGALKAGAEQLAALHLSCDAPPAFLLDANRRGEGREVLPDEFDNRSICFTTDFPSANLLCAQNIRRAVLIQPRGDQPQPDLAHALLRWQEAGFVLEQVRLDLPGAPAPFVVARPRWYGAMFQRALAALGFRRAAGGGFGGWVPESSAGG
jgi:hypothetical protein